MLGYEITLLFKISKSITKTENYPFRGLDIMVSLWMVQVLEMMVSLRMAQVYEKQCNFQEDKYYREREVTPSHFFLREVNNFCKFIEWNE